MSDKDQDDNNYELPPGIVLPQDNSPDYPNWKKGIILGFTAGLFGLLIVWFIPLKKLSDINRYAMFVLAFVMFFLIVGSIAAFRPPGDNNSPGG